MHRLSLFSNHGQLLLLLAREPDLRLRDLADRTGLTERAVHRLLADMEANAWISRTRHGRRNHYSINRGKRTTDSMDANQTLGDLLDKIYASELNRASGLDDPNSTAESRDSSIAS